MSEHQMSPIKWFSRCLVVAAAALVSTPAVPALANGGWAEPKLENGGWTVTASIRVEELAQFIDAYGEPNLEQLFCEHLERASSQIYVATAGQHYIAKVRFVNGNPAGSWQMHHRCTTCGDKGASSSRGFGWMYASIKYPDLGPNTGPIPHESGHNLYALPDEYYSAHGVPGYGQCEFSGEICSMMGLNGASVVTTSCDPQERCISVKMCNDNGKRCVDETYDHPDPEFAIPFITETCNGGCLGEGGSPDEGICLAGPDKGEPCVFNSDCNCDPLLGNCPANLNLLCSTDADPISICDMGADGLSLMAVGYGGDLHMCTPSTHNHRLDMLNGGGSASLRTGPTLMDNVLQQIYLTISQQDPKANPVDPYSAWKHMRYGFSSNLVSEGSEHYFPGYPELEIPMAYGPVGAPPAIDCEWLVDTDLGTLDNNVLVALDGSGSMDDDDAYKDAVLGVEALRDVVYEATADGWFGAYMWNHNNPNADIPTRVNGDLAMDQDHVCDDVDIENCEIDWQDVGSFVGGWTNICRALDDALPKFGSSPLENRRLVLLTDAKHNRWWHEVDGWSSEPGGSGWSCLDTKQDKTPQNLAAELCDAGVRINVLLYGNLNSSSIDVASALSECGHMNLVGSSGSSLGFKVHDTFTRSAHRELGLDAVLRSRGFLDIDPETTGPPQVQRSFVVAAGTRELRVAWVGDDSTFVVDDEDVVAFQRANFTLSGPGTFVAIEPSDRERSILTTKYVVEDPAAGVWTMTLLLDQIPATAWPQMQVGWLADIDHPADPRAHLKRRTLDEGDAVVVSGWLEDKGASVYTGLTVTADVLDFDGNVVAANVPLYDHEEKGRYRAALPAAASATPGVYSVVVRFVGLSTAARDGVDGELISDHLEMLAEPEVYVVRGDPPVFDPVTPGLPPTMGTGSHHANLALHVGGLVIDPNVEIILPGAEVSNIRIEHLNWPTNGDPLETEILFDVDVSNPAPLGATEFMLRNYGELFHTGESTIIECGNDDDGGPVLVDPPAPHDIAVCGPDVDDRELPIPTFAGRCGRTVVDVAAEVLTEIDTYPIDPTDLSGDAVRLPVGTLMVRWTVTDDGDFETVFDQRVTHRFEDWSETCCDGRVVVAGGLGSDTLVGDAQEASCVYGYVGDDWMSSGPEADRLEGGWGDDTMDTGSSNAQLLGGPGDDLLTVWGGIGQALFGGEGDDVLTASITGASGGDRWFWGGPGDDDLLGGPEDEVFFPGSGLDQVSAGDGDDLVVYHDLCEIEDFTVLIGGDGNDELVLPVPVAELPANVEIYGFETITVDGTRAYAADCHVSPPAE